MDVLQAKMNVDEVRLWTYKWMYVKEKKKKFSAHNQTLNRCLV